eukprot:GHUV01029218.1.p2 GENE.GHUV01029218.1~~GHUV01029218.1.p2  ORF type:complete len:155 (+),score=60.93 GHUV01029218.1:887-1351(+)
MSATVQYQDMLDSSNERTELVESRNADSPTGASASMQDDTYRHSVPQQQQLAATSLPANHHESSSSDSTAEVVQQLLPGLAPAAIPTVASRMLDSRRVAIGKRLGSGAFSTVYQAQLGNSSSNKWVVKRLDRVGSDQMQQVRQCRRLLLHRLHR